MFAMRFDVPFIVCQTYDACRLSVCHAHIDSVALPTRPLTCALGIGILFTVLMALWAVRFASVIGHWGFPA